MSNPTTVIIYYSQVDSIKPADAGSSADGLFLINRHFEPLLNLPYNGLALLTAYVHRMTGCVSDNLLLLLLSTLAYRVT